MPHPLDRHDTKLSDKTDTAASLVSRSALLLELSISKATLYRWIERGILPTPIKLGPAKVAFRRDEIDASIAARPRARFRNLSAPAGTK